MTVSVPIALHLFSALAALTVGATILLRTKGTPAHKAMGRVWVGLISVVAIGSFGVRQVQDGDLSWLHLLAAWTLFAITMGFLAIRRGRVKQHRAWMVGTFLGLLIAGAFALAPGRMLYRTLFG